MLLNGDKELGDVMKKDTMLNIALVVVSVSAVVLTGTALATTLRAPSGPRDPEPGSQVLAVPVKDWEALTQHGHRVGEATAAITVVEFADFQCSYCAGAAATLDSLRAAYPNQVAVLYRHYPLTRIHPHARGASIASVCAERQGAFKPFHDALYAFQDSIGKRPWSWFALRAGLLDTAALAHCIANDRSAPATVDRDVADGDRIGVSGTPTVLINGHRLLAAPTYDVVDSIARVALRQQRIRE